MATWNDWKERIGNNLITYTNKYIPNAILYTSYDLKVNSTAEVIRGIGVILLLLTALFFLGEKGLLLFLYLGATMAVLLVPHHFCTCKRTGKQEEQQSVA